jgi:general secretion pathway protein A
MYQDYFGFRERPFQLLPNPAYLFLGRCHEEALGHLLYAVSDGQGFVVISGEVGTGKTTLCRALLENLGEEVEAAYIFHPKLDPLELLQAIAVEFGIPSGAETTRELIDLLHHFLISKKEERKKVLLLIDEAQNLTADVLEQIRLLSNLETSTSKLIQIVLVGQPELIELLDSHELRQLKQRVSLRCRLSPLSLDETREYIRHRLRQASRDGRDDLFTHSAMARIYRYSGGIPRLVNIACDRALLFGYGSDCTRITGTVARKAIEELRETDPARSGGLVARTKKAVCVLLTLALVLVLDGWFPRSRLENDGRSDRSSSPEKQDPGAPLPRTQPMDFAAVRTGTEPAPFPASPDSPVEPRLPEGLREWLHATDRDESRRRALAIAVGLWSPGFQCPPRLDSLGDDLTFFRLSAQGAGLSVTPISGGVSMLSLLDLPAILVLTGPDTTEPRYVALTGISGDDALRLQGIGNSGVIERKAGDLSPYWAGQAYVVWKDFLGLGGGASTNDSREEIISLKLLLADMGFEGVDESPVYDTATRDIILDIQKRHGIFEDGLVGPLTAMALYHLAGTFPSPHLKEATPP